MSKFLGKLIPASLDSGGILIVGISLLLVGAGLALALFIDDKTIQTFAGSLGIALFLAVIVFIIGLHVIDYKTAEYIETLEVPTVEELEKEIDAEKEDHEPGRNT